MTDSDVSRKDREELKEVATTVEDHIGPSPAGLRALLLLGSRWARLVIQMKWLVIVLALTVAQACDAPWAGPTLPAGGHWVAFTTVSYEGPNVYREGIFAGTSTAGVEAAVLGFETSGHSGYRLDQACWAPCWRLVRAEEPGLLYLAVATFSDGCDNTVKEAAAVAGRALYLIHWVSSPNGSRCDAAPTQRWRLLSVSRRDLPGPGTLTVRLQMQGADQGGFESVVELS